MEDNTKLVKRKKKRIHKPVIVTMAEIILAIIISLVIASIVAFLKGDINPSEPVETTTETETTTEIELETETETEIIELGTQKEVETETETEIETETEPQYVSLGIYTITAYCSCNLCCGEFAENRPLDENGDPIVYGASGEELIANYSVATDVGLIPYGEVILINDQEYIAHDCGGAIKGNRIDIYMSTHEMALEWGVQNIEIFKVVS